MVMINIGKVTFELKEFQDLSWLNTIGKVVYVQKDEKTGILSFGLEKGEKKYYIQYAGASFENQKAEPKKAVKDLIQSIKGLEEPSALSDVQYVRKMEMEDGTAILYQWLNVKKEWDSEINGIYE